MGNERSAGRLMRGGRTRRAWVCWVVLLVAAGCDSTLQSGTGKKDTLLAQVNGEPITRQDVRAHLMTHGEQEIAEKAEKPIPRVVLDQLVERRLLLQRFRETGEYVSEGKVRNFVKFIRSQYGEADFSAIMKEQGIDEESWLKAMRETLEIEHLLEREVYSKLKVSESEIEAYYNRNKEKFRAGRRWRVRQIVVSSAKIADKLRKLVLEGKSFASLAQKHSTGPESSVGGDLGYFQQGELPENIENVVGSLKLGEVSRVVKSPAGFHLLEVSERRMPFQKTLASVREDIRKQLLAEKGRAKLEGWLGELKRNAKIKYYRENLEVVG
ncbi:MAG: peptidyl-prolyl cis-trans isomerase [Nitrospinae bacterium]|nr:peptidyl-prolyl cis-trans isomerase [Nitrospinota bacterium]